MDESEKPVAVGMRAPADLAAWLKKQAEENNRSVSMQAVWALNQFRKQAETQGAVQ